jgi:hypothetical protein
MTGEKGSKLGGIWRRREDRAGLVLTAFALTAGIAAGAAFRTACFVRWRKKLAAHFTTAMDGIHAI